MKKDTKAQYFINMFPPTPRFINRTDITSHAYSPPYTHAKTLHRMSLKQMQNKKNTVDQQLNMKTAVSE